MSFRRKKLKNYKQSKGSSNLNEHNHLITAARHYPLILTVYTIPTLPWEFDNLLQVVVQSAIIRQCQPHPLVATCPQQIIQPEILPFHLGNLRPINRYHLLLYHPRIGNSINTQIFVITSDYKLGYSTTDIDCPKFLFKSVEVEDIDHSTFYCKI